MMWQPIETAPKHDLLSIILFIPSKGRFGVKSGFYEKQYGAWAWYGCSGKREALLNQPTHWMPLPAPPEQNKPETGTSDSPV